MIVGLSFKIKFIPMKIHKTVATIAAPFCPDMHQKGEGRWGEGGEGRWKEGKGKGGEGREEGDGRTNPKPADTGLLLKFKWVFFLTKSEYLTFV